MGTKLGTNATNNFFSGGDMFQNALKLVFCCGRWGGGSMMKKSQFEIQQAAAEPRTADDGSPSCSVMSHSDVVVWKTDGSTRVLHPVFNNTDKTTLGPKGPWTWRANFMFETN